MSSKEPGYVYILTNPSFREDWVKLQFKYTKADIRSIDDIDDPYGDDASFCRIFPFQLTEVGIEFIDCPWIDFRIAINTTTRCWRKIKEEENLQEDEFDVRADYKNKKTKADFLEGELVEISYFTQLIEEFQNDQ